MQRDVEKFVEFSSAHITEKDSQLLDEDETFGLVCHRYGYGYFIFNDIQESVLRDVGFSEAFINLFKEATKEGCWWIRLDSIAKVYDDLPTFDW